MRLPDPCDYCVAKDAEIARLTAGIQIERHHLAQTRGELERTTAELLQWHAAFGTSVASTAKRMNDSVIAEWDALRAECIHLCQWEAGENGLYDTDCGHAFVTESGSLEECEFKFCIYCGKPIKEIPWKDPWADEEA